MINILGVIFLIVMSYPISHYFMKKGMTLDLTMPVNIKRYRKLGIIFKVPILNVIVMFTYLLWMLHKFERV